jgi:hypothetical protein
MELAQVVIWIGYLQWMHDNGFAPRNNPVLEPIETATPTPFSTEPPQR